MPIADQMKMAGEVVLGFAESLADPGLDLHTAALAVTMAFALFLMLKHLRWYMRVSALPGPKPTGLLSRLFGNACNLLTLKKDINMPTSGQDKLEADVMNYFAENMQQHLSDGFFAMHMWPLKKGMVMVFEPSVIKYILSLKGHQQFKKGHIYSIAEALVGKGVMSTDGPVWHKQRKLVEKGFRLKTLELAVDATQHTMRDLYPLWDKACEANSSVDVLGDMLKVTMDVLGHVAFSYNFGSVRAGNMTVDTDGGAETGEKLGAPLYEAFRVILWELTHRCRQGSWRKYIPSAGTRRFNKAVTDLDTVVNRVVEERLARMKTEEEAQEARLSAEMEGGTATAAPTDGLLPPTLEINEAPVQTRDVKLLDNADNDVLSELLAPSRGRARSRSRSSSADASSSTAKGDSKWGSGGDKNDGLTKQEVKDNIKTFLFAGHDTTASALSWALYLITTHPEVEAKILEELSTEMLPCFDTGSPRASSSSSSSSSPRAVNVKAAQEKAEKANKVSEIRSLRYLDAVVKEVLRLCPSAGFTRKPVHDVEINGHTIPAGTEMVIFPWLLHQHPEMGEDANEFNPGRWMEKDSAKAKLAKQMYLPFSLGPRNCVGMQLALTEMKTALILLLQRYRFKLADTAAPPPKMVCLMTLFPSDIALVPERRIRAHHERFQSSLKKSPSSLGFI